MILSTRSLTTLLSVSDVLRCSGPHIDSGQKWETLLKSSEANSTQCSQAVTHPSTVWVSMSLDPEARSAEGERLMETHILRQLTVVGGSLFKSANYSVSEKIDWVPVFIANLKILHFLSLKSLICICSLVQTCFNITISMIFSYIRSKILP